MACTPGFSSTETVITLRGPSRDDRRNLVLDHHFLVNQQHFIHLALKFRIPPFQVILHFMRLQLLLVQNPLHSGFGGPSQAGVASGFGSLADMSRQRFARPQFGGVAEVFGLGAGQMNDPSFVGHANDRFFGAVKRVLKAGFQPHRQCLPKAAVNRDSADAQGLLDSGGILTGIVTQKNARPFNLPHRRGARSAHRFEASLFLRCQDQRRQLGLSGHAPEPGTSAAFCKAFNETMY